MQTVYEIFLDDMPIELPLFSDLDRAKFEYGQLIIQLEKQALTMSKDVYVEYIKEGLPEYVIDACYILINGQLVEFAKLAIYERLINTAPISASHS